ncbi:glycine C-acetyltransferase [Sphingopyxis sp.]|uniref:glycine C-acetyltransferase n=1 Tax=Sphingopyxis sp. TaxID=1908224 RepID=UPI002ED85E80
MSSRFYEYVVGEIAAIEAQGLWKPERIMASPQGAAVTLAGRAAASINLCANNYLGLASDQRVIDAAVNATRRWGAGLASVRFICGTQEIHRELETSIAAYLGFEDAIIFAAAFDANGGLFEPLLGEDDAIISDSLNHASIIDGIRLCKAKRLRFATGDMGELEERLRKARDGGARTILIATDGVFSMDGAIANLAAITVLADRYEALVMVDDCHATGLLGTKGRGTAAYRDVEGRVDIITGTFGKALGGAMGGFIAARREVVALLRQRARPYLFSNALAPSICGASLAAIEIARSDEGDVLRDRLFANTRRFRAGMEKAGFDLLPGEHPIIPVMLHDAARAQAFAAALLEAGIFVTGFSYPVVPKGLARIRTQMSAAHSPQQIDQAVEAFALTAKQLEAAR